MQNNKKMNDLTRRDFMKIAAVGAGGLTLAGAAFGDEKQTKNIKEMLLYIGTYTSGKSRSEGIYIYKFNAETGALSPHKIVKNVVEPSYLAIDKSKKYLYAVNETVEFAGKKSGAVSAFQINQKTGELTFLNQQPSLGGAPCYIAVSRDEKFVLVANYLGGNASVFPIQADGKIGASVELKQNSGTGPNKDRQEAAHAHSINLDEKNRFAYLCDLGVDKIFIYEFDKKSGALKTNQAQAFYQANAGFGPRHFAFHPHKNYAFVINELASSVTALARDENTGTLRTIQTVSTLPADFKGANTCADLHVAPNGKFLYGSNRGHDSLAAFKIDEQTGKLELVGHTPTGGKTPRNFVIEPSGKFLLAANQNSDSVVVFRLDESTGNLARVGEPVTVPTPVCLKLVPNFS